MVIGEALKKLCEVGSRRDAELLLSKITNMDILSLTLKRNNTLTASQEKALFEYYNRKEAGEPVQYIMGECEFMSLEFLVDKNVLSIVSKSDNNTLLNVISIIEEELPKLKFNVNYKLWLDSLFSKLTIGG